jgi:predicted permease
MLLYAFGIALATTLLFALMPALRLAHSDAQRSLKDQSSGAGGVSALRVRKLLMISQVVFTTVLLAGAGLFTESLVNLRRVNLGMNPDHVMEFSISPELNRYTPAQALDLVERLRKQVAALPGVRTASAAEIPVLADSENSSNISAEGYTPSESENTDVGENFVGPDYFSTMNIALIKGREFREADSAMSPKVAIVNQKFAERFFAGRDPLGKRIMFGVSNTRKPDIEIVGVVQNSRHSNPRQALAPFLYTPYSQFPRLGHATFYVRSSQDPLSLSNSIRASVASLDQSLPVYNLMTLNERRDESVFADRLMAMLCVALGSLAALLAALGLYGVMAYIVARRTREIGIRMALGATRSGVAWLVLKEVLQMSAIGLVAGLAGAAITGHLAQSLLFGVSGANPLVLGITAGFLIAIAVLAGSFPARRAAGVQPMVALRYE